MAYDFYLEKCLLPIAPSRLQIKTGSNNKTLSLINEGQINLLKTAGLKDIEFECLIPQMRYPFAGYREGFKDAAYYLDCFERLKNEKKPFQFIVCRISPSGKPLFSTNIKVSMEDYTVTESADNGFDLTVKIRLRQYRDHVVKTVCVKPLGTQTTAERAPSAAMSEIPVTVGCDVIVNGRLHGSSYGDAPGQYRTNYRGKINFINLKGSHPFHVTTPEGVWQGWVTKESIRVIINN